MRLKWVLRFFIVLFMSHSALASEDNHREKGLGLHLSYIYALGNISDYYKNNFTLNIGGMWEFYEDNLGKVYAVSGLQYIPMKGDDIRESSSLQLLSLNLGIDQELYRNSWYTFLTTLRFEYTRWWVSNRLSKDYDAFDRGAHYGEIFGFNNKFQIFREFFISFPLLIHSQQFSLTNIYFDMGFGVEKTF